MLSDATGPRHVSTLLPVWLLWGIYARRHVDPNAAACVADWRAQGLLPPEPGGRSTNEDCAAVCAVK